MRKALVLFGVVGLLAVLPANAADTYEIDAVHTMVLFKVSHLGFSNTYGRFTDVKGAFTIDEDNPSSSSVDVRIMADSLTTQHEGRDKHLKSPDFLNAAEFPTITFKSTSVSVDGDRYSVTGDFTMRGVKKPITLELDRLKTGEFRGSVRTGFDGSHTLKRSDYGVSYMLGPIPDDVTILLSIEGIRE